MQQFFHAGIKARLNLHMGQIVGQGCAFNHPHIHATAFDGRFTALNPLGIGGYQRHFRSLMTVMIKQDPGTDQRSHDGKNPHR